MWQTKSLSAANVEHKKGNRGWEPRRVADFAGLDTRTLSILPLLSEETKIRGFALGARDWMARRRDQNCWLHALSASLEDWGLCRKVGHPPFVQISQRPGEMYIASGSWICYRFAFYAKVEGIYFNSCIIGPIYINRVDQRKTISCRCEACNCKTGQSTIWAFLCWVI